MKKSTKRIKHAVVIVNFENWHDTVDCINSIKKTKDTPHIVVVDNHSSDDSVHKLKESFPDLDLVVAEENLGFSRGNNLGIAKALKLGAQVVYLLNNDTEVDSNLFFRAYRYVADKNRIAGAKIYYARGSEYHEDQKGQGNILWYAGGEFDWSMAISRHFGVDEEDRGQYDKVKQVDFITGCFMAIPRKVFKKIGFLREEFFLYLEDSEFCLHAKSAGVEVMYNPSLVLYHKNSGSTKVGSPLVDYYMTRNRFFIAKHYGSLRLRVALLKEGLRNFWKMPVRRMAFIDYLTGRMGNRNEKIFALVAKIKA
jgi:GT2 family glycosyltransferase